MIKALAIAFTFTFLSIPILSQAGTLGQIGPITVNKQVVIESCKKLNATRGVLAANLNDKLLKTFFTELWIDVNAKYEDLNCDSLLATPDPSATPNP